MISHNKVKIFSYFVFVIICAFSDKTLQDTTSQSVGNDCDVLIPTLLRESIPDTSLNTGTFYIVRMKSENHNPEAGLPAGFVTWSSEPDPSKHKYIYADMHHNMQKYKEGKKWYKDSHWAFLMSRQAGWYHLINCRFPTFYATWSDENMDGDASANIASDQHPFVISPCYPGNYTIEDFLFKPVRVNDERNRRVFRLMTKAFGEGIVSVSKTIYYSHNESNYLQVESKLLWEERVKASEDRSLFVFEEAHNAEDGQHPQYTYQSTEDEECFCGKTVVFYIMVSSWIWIIAAVVWLKKQVIITHINS